MRSMNANRKMALLSASMHGTTNTNGTPEVVLVSTPEKCTSTKFAFQGMFDLVCTICLGIGDQLGDQAGLEDSSKKPDSPCLTGT